MAEPLSDLTTTTFRVGIHPALSYVPHDADRETRKRKKTAMAAKASSGVQNVKMTLVQFLEHVNAERGFMAAMTDGHRSTASAQAFALIADDDQIGDLFEAKVAAFVQRTGYAVIIGSTATVGHHRAIVPFTGTTSDPELYRLFSIWLSSELGANTDPASNVIAQPWLGFRKGTARLSPGKLLTLDELMGFTSCLREAAAQEAWEREQRHLAMAFKPIEQGSDAAAQSVQRALEHAYQQIVSVGENENRKGKIAGQVRWLATFLAHYPITKTEIEWTAFAGAAKNGALAKYGDKGIQEAIDWGYAHGLGDVPEPLEAPTRKAHKPKKSVRRRLEKQAATADQTKTVAYVGDDLTTQEIASYATLMIQAGTGMGKTTALAAYERTLAQDAYITALAQFRLLTSGMHTHMPSFTHYEQADGAHQRALGQLNRLITSISSLTKFDRHGGIVIADEITGVLQFLAESSTFQGGAAITAYRALVRLIETATQVIGMDANLDDITLDFMREHRGTVELRRYQRATPRGKVTLLKDRVAAVSQLEKLLGHRRGQVYAACSSEAMTTMVTEHFTSLGYHVLKITRDTSNTEKVRQAVRHAQQRAAYDLIAYDAAMGAGVDIAEPVYAQVGIFDNRPLTPEQAIQLFGRVRFAERRYAAVPPESEGYQTPTADELLEDICKREHWTAQRLHGASHSAGDMLALARLAARFRERALCEAARWRHYFAQRLQADGFNVVEINARAPEAFAEAWKQWRADRDDQQFAFVLAAEGRALPEVELDKLRSTGVEITADLSLRHRRWEIETVKADERVTENDRDLMKATGRRRLRHLRDWFSAMDELEAEDQQQRDEEHPIHHRRYTTLAREALASLFTLMEHSGTPEAQLLGFIATFEQGISRDDVAKRHAMLASAEAMKKFKALGHYGNNAETVPGLCRWLLEYFGLKLNSERKRVDGKLSMVYRIDEESLTYRLKRARYAAQNRQMITNVYSSFKYTKVISHPAENPLSQPDISIGWAAEPERFERQFTQALGVPTKRKFSRVTGKTPP